MSEAYECEKYICTPETIKETIATFGVAIIPNLLIEQEIEEMITEMWSYLSHITRTWPSPISRANTASWKEIHKLHLLRGAMFQQFSAGQTQFMWNLRQNPKLVAIFSLFWNVEPEDLLVSFDGANFFIPNNALPECRKNNKKFTELEKPWYHLDQSVTRPDFEVIQSWVTAYDVSEGDATLGFLEKSNQFFGEFGENTSAKSVSDWKILSDTEMEFYKSRGCEEKRIRCPAGSLVMWDSRTVHYGAPSLKKGSEQTFRLVSYICYRPRYFITHEQLSLKQKAFNEMDTCSHHPTNFRVFKKLPAHTTLPHLITQIEPPVLSELGRKLAGF